MLVELIAKNAGAEQEHFAYKPRPSSVGRCIRALVYDAKGIEGKPFADRALLVFADGHWHEELLKDAIRKTAYELIELKGGKQRIEIATIDGVVMDGEIDGLLQDPLGRLRLLEIKSINHFGFERLQDGPLDDHRRQANLYLHGLRKAGFEIDEALILYKNKNTAAMKEFFVGYDEAQALADIVMFERVAAMAKGDDLPARPYDMDDWHCGYCRHQKRCWANYADEVQALSTDVALSQEIETAARYFNELGAQKGEIEKERDGIGKTLRQALSAANAQSGRAGEYILKLSVGTRRKLIDSAVPAEAYEQVPSERFTVKRIKQEGEGNGKVHANKGRRQAAKHYPATAAGQAKAGD